MSEIKKVLDSKFSKEELRKCAVRKQLENELSKKQTQLLEELSEGKDIEKVNAEIIELNKKQINYELSHKHKHPAKSQIIFNFKENRNGNF